MRMMNNTIEVHESIRQIKMALDLYNHSCSDMVWYSQIIHRELVKFEMAERKRLRDSLELKLIRSDDVRTIIEPEVYLILIGALTQTLNELEHSLRMEMRKLTRQLR